MNVRADVDAATAWLAQFESSLAGGDALAVSELFAAECYWRDLVSFTWNIRTMEGREAIVAMLRSQLASHRTWQIHGAGRAGHGRRHTREPGSPSKRRTRAARAICA